MPKDNEFTIEGINRYDDLIEEKEKEIRGEKRTLGLAALTAALQLAVALMYRSNTLICTLWAIACAFQCINVGLKWDSVKKLKKEIDWLKEWGNNNPSLTKRIK